MIETFFTCDRCKRRWQIDDPATPAKDRPQMVAVGLCVEYGKRFAPHAPIFPSIGQTWCRDCALALGAEKTKLGSKADGARTVEQVMEELLDLLGVKREDD